MACGATLNNVQHHRTRLHVFSLADPKVRHTPVAPFEPGLGPVDDVGGFLAFTRSSPQLDATHPLATSHLEWGGRPVLSRPSRAALRMYCTLDRLAVRSQHPSPAVTGPVWYPAVSTSILARMQPLSSQYRTWTVTQVAFLSTCPTRYIDLTRLAALGIELDAERGGVITIPPVLRSPGPWTNGRAPSSRGGSEGGRNFGLATRPREQPNHLSDSVPKHDASCTRVV